MLVLDMEEIKKIPGYKVILKAVLKTQIQYMVEQLATHTDEESVILTASVSDGTLSHLGSDSGKGFLEDNEEVKSQFLGFCLKRHEQNKQVTEDDEKEQEHEGQMLETDQVMPVLTQMGFAPGFRRNRMSPSGFMRSSSQRFEPYTTQRQQRNSTSSDPGLFSLPTSESKDIEPSEHSNDGSDTILTETPQVSGLDSKDDEKSNSSSASTIPNEQSEGTPAGEQGDSEVDPNVSVKVEAITESEMEHDANTGATEMEDDLQQNYRHEQNQQVTEDEEKQEEHEGQMLETDQLMPVLTQMEFDSELESNTIKSPQRISTSSNPSQLSLATVEVKVEPSEHSNDGSDTNLTKSPQVSGIDSKDDEKSNSSSASTIPNEQSEGTPAGEQGDSEVDPNVSVTKTMETVYESEMELDPNSGATGIESDLQQNYKSLTEANDKNETGSNDTEKQAIDSVLSSELLIDSIDMYEKLKQELKKRLQQELELKIRAEEMCPTDPKAAPSNSDMLTSKNDVLNTNTVVSTVPVTNSNVVTTESNVLTAITDMLNAYSVVSTAKTDVSVNSNVVTSESNVITTETDVLATNTVVSTAEAVVSVVNSNMVTAESNLFADKTDFFTANTDTPTVKKQSQVTESLRKESSIISESVNTVDNSAEKSKITCVNSKDLNDSNSQISNELETGKIDVQIQKCSEIIKDSAEQNQIAASEKNQSQANTIKDKTISSGNVPTMSQGTSKNVAQKQFSNVTASVSKPDNAIVIDLESSEPPNQRANRPLNRGLKTPSKQTVRKMSTERQSPAGSSRTPTSKSGPTSQTTPGKKNFIDNLISKGVPIIIPDEEDEVAMPSPRSSAFKSKSKQQLHYGDPKPMVRSPGIKQATNKPGLQQYASEHYTSQMPDKTKFARQYDHSNVDQYSDVGQIPSNQYPNQDVTQQYANRNLNMAQQYQSQSSSQKLMEQNAGQQFLTQPHYTVPSSTQKVAAQSPSQKFAAQSPSQKFAAQSPSQKFAAQSPSQKFASQSPSHKYAMQSLSHYADQAPSQKYGTQSASQYAAPSPSQNFPAQSPSQQYHEQSLSQQYQDEQYYSSVPETAIPSFSPRQQQLRQRLFSPPKNVKVNTGNEYRGSPQRSSPMRQPFSPPITPTKPKPNMATFTSPSRVSDILLQQSPSFSTQRMEQSPTQPRMKKAAPRIPAGTTIVIDDEQPSPSKVQSRPAPNKPPSSPKLSQQSSISMASQSINQPMSIAQSIQISNPMSLQPPQQSDSEKSSSFPIISNITSLPMFSDQGNPTSSVGMTLPMTQQVLYVPVQLPMQVLSQMPSPAIPTSLPSTPIQNTNEKTPVKVKRERLDEPDTSPSSDGSSPASKRLHLSGNTSTEEHSEHVTRSKTYSKFPSTSSADMTASPNKVKLEIDIDGVAGYPLAANPNPVPSVSSSSAPDNSGNVSDSSSVSSPVSPSSKHGSSSKKKRGRKSHKHKDDTEASTSKSSKGKKQAFGCGDCGKSFKSKAALNVHFKKHTPSPPFECDVCGKHYSQKSSLKKHIYTHFKQNE